MPQLNPLVPKGWPYWKKNRPTVIGHTDNILFSNLSYFAIQLVKISKFNIDVMDYEVVEQNEKQTTKWKG